MQFHGGVYRSDDAGETLELDRGRTPGGLRLPDGARSRRPRLRVRDPDGRDGDRVTVDGRVRVFGTRDAGESWTSLSDGLPQEDAFLTILRQAFDRDGRGRGAGPVLRSHVGRRVRVGGRGRLLVHRPGAPRAGELGPGRLDRPEIRHLPGVSEGGPIMGPWERSSCSRSTGIGGTRSSTVMRAPGAGGRAARSRSSGGGRAAWRPRSNGSSS